MGGVLREGGESGRGLVFSVMMRCNASREGKVGGVLCEGGEVGVV